MYVWQAMMSRFYSAIEKFTDLHVLIIDSTFRTLDNIIGMSMNIAQDMVVAAVLQSSTQQSSILQVINSNCTVTFESEMQQVEVLGDNRCSRSRKVEREGIFDRSQVM